MDNTVKEMEAIQKRIANKYSLNTTENETFERAIATYDYLQNEGVIFNTRNILDCFEEETAAPSTTLLKALCDYIVDTIAYYEPISINGRRYFNTNAENAAKDLRKGVK